MGSYISYRVNYLNNPFTIIFPGMFEITVCESIIEYVWITVRIQTYGTILAWIAFTINGFHMPSGGILIRVSEFILISIISEVIESDMRESLAIDDKRMPVIILGRMVLDDFEFPFIIFIPEMIEFVLPADDVRNAILVDSKTSFTKIGNEFRGL